MLMLVVHRSELQGKVCHCNFMTWQTKMWTDNLRSQDVQQTHITYKGVIWREGAVVRGLDTVSLCSMQSSHENFAKSIRTQDFIQT